MSKIIGKCDKLDFPSLLLYGIACKIDTGAETSAIHCSKVKLLETLDGKEVLKFFLLDPRHPDYNNREFRFESFSEKEVKSSIGQKELRYSIQSEITIYGETYPIEFTLANREEMRYPILIGRKFLAKNKFLVNPSRRDLSYKEMIQR